MGDLALSPGSEAQRKRQVLQIARATRRAYRAADSAGELLERWLDRQIDRKTRIMPRSVSQGIQLFRAYHAQVKNVESMLTDLAYVSTNL